MHKTAIPPRNDDCQYDKITAQIYQSCKKTAGKIIKPKVLIPYHLSQTDLQAIKDGLEGSGIDVHLYENLR